VRWGLISSDSDCSFGEQHAGEVVHATIISHAAHHALWVTGIGGIGVSNGTPLDEFFAGLSVLGLASVVEDFTWDSFLLFAWAIAWLCDETLEEPTHGREN